MRLQFGIAFNLAFIACLSSFMLGLGSSTHFSTVLVFLAAAASLYLTDISKKIQLNRFVSNALILAIVFGSIGGILQFRTVDLAIGIARLLQLVQIVVLFQEKNPRNRWHILMISLLQVIVATAFQQSLSFGLLLLVYVFANLCALTLIFLHDENAYFKRHSFVRGAFQLHSAELRQKQDWNRLLKIAIATFIVGPLSLILSYRDTEKEDTSKLRNSPNKPQDAKFRQSFASKEKSDIHWEAATADATGFADLWEDLESDDFTETSDAAIPILTNHVVAENEKNHEKLPLSRWPLLHSIPVFSGGTNRKTGVIGGQRELYSRLLGATLWSLLIGAGVFLLIPRFNGVEFFGQRFSYERWNSGNTPTVSSVGFTEEIRLGSLGNVLQNYQEVLTIDFIQPTVDQVNKAQGIGSVWAPYPPRDPMERNYAAIEGNSFYLRGVVVDHYERGRWTRSNSSVSSNPLSSFFQPIPQSESNWQPRSNHQTVPQGDVSQMKFVEPSDLLKLRITTQPLDSRVLFTVWPFYVLPLETNRISITPDRIELPIVRRNRRQRPFTQSYYTTAFYRGEQAELTPCSEQVNVLALLQMTRDKMPELVKLAQKWDKEANLPSNDLAGRARNLEERLKTDERFQYQLGGIVRDLSLDPLEDFVSKNPRGHCEFFAGTLAMMLRSVEIPARICIGYKTLAENKGNEGYLVRQSDAHCWVEAFLPNGFLPENLATGRYSPHWQNGAWLRLDATPDYDIDLLQEFSMNFSDLISGIQSLWQNYVMNMDGARQTELVYGPAQRMFQAAASWIQTNQWKETCWMIFERYKDIYSQIRAGTLKRTDMLLMIPPLAIFLGGAYFLIRLGVLRLFRRILGGLGNQGRNRQASIEFYMQLERLLAKISIQRQEFETQREFVKRAVPLLSNRLSSAEEKFSKSENFDSLSPDFLGQSASNIVETFYKIRFGDEPLSDPEFDRIENDLHLLKTATDFAHQSQ